MGAERLRYNQNNSRHRQSKDLYDAVKDGLILDVKSAREIKNFVKPNKRCFNLIENDTVAVLKPPEIGDCQLPVISAYANDDDDFIETKVVLALFTRDEDENLCCVAYRYESRGQGIHNYFHIQLTNRWMPSDNGYIPQVVKWRPDSIPAFAVDAQNAVQLLISLIVSIYGSKAILELTGMGGRLQRHLDGMHLSKAF